MKPTDPTDSARGLSSAEAAARLARDGPNSLGRASSRSLLSIVVHQFKSLIVLLLVVASSLALFTGERLQAAAIVVVIVLNAAIGAFTEWKAARALEGLREQADPIARVVRDGVERQLRAAALVVGDVVLLGAGDRVPADGRVSEAAQLLIDESALTGESTAVEKFTDGATDTSVALGDRTGAVHMATAVTDGRGRFTVTATGVRTEVGKIGALVESAGDRESPLEQKLAQLSRSLVVLVLGLCAVIVLVGWLRGLGLMHMVEVGVSLSIAAVPEGLLAVTTMTLAVGMQRMARMHALVRRLPAVESLGSTTVICTDKTGTLTRNEMTVRAYVVGGRRIDVTGTGYAADGRFELESEPIDATIDTPPTSALRVALRIGALCNDAKVDRSTKTPSVLGDPTEAALIVAAEKASVDRSALLRDEPRVAEVAFDSERKVMVTVHERRDRTLVAYVKGAPASVLAACESALGDGTIEPLTEDEKREVLDRNGALASSALRVLALAYRPLPVGYSPEDLRRELVFVGLVGMIDPLRDGAKETIATCRRAGLRTVMITGDQEETAAEIARQLGIDVDERGAPLRTVHARALEGLTPDGWREVVAGTSVFARVSPAHKLLIVDALQREGHVVAMTGDGVNDAPALRKADIGIAMGIRGTEVAKEASDMVITDDDFSTIVRAIEQGRIVVHNIQRFLHYLFSTNLSEIVTVFVAVLVGWPLPLGVLQILWLNLVTDIFPAMALALEPSAPDVMTAPPRDPNEPLMTPRFAWLILWQGALLGASSLFAFYLGMRSYGRTGVGLRHAITIAFMTLAFAQVLHAFNTRSRSRSLASGLLSNRWLWGATLLCLLLLMCAVYFAPLRRVLATHPLTLADWALVTGCAVFPLAIVELVKMIQRRRPARSTPPVRGRHVAP
ncbi:MAG: cation-transporting P-type ATPase [Myxococcales bacterium]|nr:cation-transporting P-type ATPase [Myxococcales bacterium]